MDERDFNLKRTSLTWIIDCLCGALLIGMTVWTACRYPSLIHNRIYCKFPVLDRAAFSKPVRSFLRMDKSTLDKAGRTPALFVRFIRDQDRVPRRAEERRLFCDLT